MHNEKIYYCKLNDNDRYLNINDTLLIIENILAVHDTGKRHPSVLPIHVWSA